MKITNTACGDKDDGSIEFRDIGTAAVFRARAVSSRSKWNYYMRRQCGNMAINLKDGMSRRFENGARVWDVLEAELVIKDFV